MPATSSSWMMHGIAALSGVSGLALLWRTRPPAATPGAYAGRVAGTMLAALGLILFVFAAALPAGTR